MARPVEGVTRSDIDAIRFDDLSFDGVHGRVGLTLFMPSARQIGRQGDPEIVVPYSAGWGEGLGAARTACEALVRTANVMAVAIEYPRKRLGVSDILPFRTRVYGDVIRHIKDRTLYDFASVVAFGYSRGTMPARLAAVQRADDITGLCLVAPTWFRGTIKPRELAQRGIAESARGMVRSGWMDRIGLLGASVRLAQELVTHPLALRDDVQAISHENATGLQDVLDRGVHVGVIGGTYDELCEISGIRQVMDSLDNRETVDYREVESDHFSYFLSPRPLRAVADLVLDLGRPTR
jgi:hypothetical protein